MGEPTRPLAVYLGWVLAVWLLGEGAHGEGSAVALLGVCGGLGKEVHAGDLTLSGGQKQEAAGAGPAGLLVLAPPVQVVGVVVVVVAGAAVAAAGLVVDGVGGHDQSQYQTT